MRESKGVRLAATRRPCTICTTDCAYASRHAARRMPISHRCSVCACRSLPAFLVAWPSDRSWKDVSSSATVNNPCALMPAACAGRPPAHAADKDVWHEKLVHHCCGHQGSQRQELQAAVRNMSAVSQGATAAAAVALKNNPDSCQTCASWPATAAWPHACSSHVCMHACVLHQVAQPARSQRKEGPILRVGGCRHHSGNAHPRVLGQVLACRIC